MTEFLLAVLGLFFLSAILVGGSTAFVFREQIWPTQSAQKSQKKIRLYYLPADGSAQRVAPVAEANGLVSNWKISYVRASMELAEIAVRGRLSPSDANPIARASNLGAFVSSITEGFESNRIHPQKIPSYA